LIPYWILFAVFALASLESTKKKPGNRQNSLIFLLASVGIALMIGFRYEVGGDWGQYQRYLARIGHYPLKTALGQGEPGYAIINWVAGRLGLGIWFVNLICGSIFSWGLVRFARMQPNAWLAILISVPYLIIVVAMGYTRQAVALGFIMAGLASFERSSIFRFSLYVLGALLFHRSAIFLLPLVALAETRNRFINLALIIALSIALYYVFVAESVDRLITNYVAEEYQSQGATIRVLMNLIPSLIFIIFQKRFGLNSVQRKLWRNFSILSLITFLMLFFTTATTAVDRLALYLIPLQIFVFSRLPMLAGDRTSSRSQIHFILILYCASVQFVWLNFADNARYWVPYGLYRAG
jgi:hypothetical protein